MSDDSLRPSMDEVRIPGSAVPAAAPALIAPRPMVTAGLGMRFLGRVLTNAVPVVTTYAGVVLYLFAAGTAMLVLAFALFLSGLGWGVWQVQRVGASGANQARRLVGVAVVDQVTGQPIGFGRSLLREVAPGFLSAITCGIFGLVDLAIALANPERLSVHDRLARTRVIQFDSMPAPPLPTPPSAGAPVSPPIAPGPAAPALARQSSTQDWQGPAPHEWSGSSLIEGAPGLAPAPVAPSPRPSIALESETRVRPVIALPQESQASAASHPVLVVDGGQRIEVSGTVLVGRNPTAAGSTNGATPVTIPDPGMSLSKTHAAFGLDEDGSLWVEDRASTNGVALVLDGQERPIPPNERTPVPPGASVRLGDRELTVEQPGDSGGVVPIDGMPSNF